MYIKNKQKFKEYVKKKLLSGYSIEDIAKERRVSKYKIKQIAKEIWGFQEESPEKIAMLLEIKSKFLYDLKESLKKKYGYIR